MKKLSIKVALGSFSLILSVKLKKSEKNKLIYATVKLSKIESKVRLFPPYF